jgi:hypothetical protein
LRNCLSVDSDGLSGGLALFWDESINVTLLFQGDRYIDVTIKEDPSATPWRATFVYGEPHVDKRKEMWDVLRGLCGAWPGPWMLIGDFNETMWQYEHFSETPRPERQMMDFREVLSHCDLHDLGFTGLPWTYNNNQGGRRNVRVRLDRGVANTDWSIMFPNASVLHLFSAYSDHKALLLNVDRASGVSHQRRIFRYEIMWEREPELQTVIERSWTHKNPGSDLGALSSSLAKVTADLQQWSTATFDNITKRIKELKMEMEKLEGEGPIQNRDKIHEVKWELDEILYREEMMWLQRSRIDWLREGDRTLNIFIAKPCGEQRRIGLRSC